MQAYGKHIDSLRCVEFPRQHLDSPVFLDAASKPPAPLSALDAVHLHLTRECEPISNPHSSSASGLRTRQRIDEVRELVCREIFGVNRTGGSWRPHQSDYQVVEQKGKNKEERNQGWELIFTSGATASLELAARSFDFGGGLGEGKERGAFAYLDEAHSSLIGLRDIVTRERGDRGASRVIPLKADGPQLNAFIDAVATSQSSSSSLLALPLQCNATGRRYNDLLCASLRRNRAVSRKSSSRTYILLDAASYLSPSTRLPLHDLFGSDRLIDDEGEEDEMPDFIAFSFYKLLGSPTGLGGLLVRRSSVISHLLTSNGKQYFGGGAISAITALASWREPARELHAALEDGTVNLQGILSIPTMLSTLRSSALLGSWAQSGAYVDGLTRYMWSSLNNLRHGDNSNVCRLYSASPRQCAKIVSVPSLASSSSPLRLDQGPIILFNVCRPASASRGSEDEEALSRRSLIIEPSEVDRLASISGIHLRCGRMCNAGALAHALELIDDDFQKLWHLGIGCGMTDQRASLKDSTGAARLISSCLRASLCAWNTKDDIDKLVDFLQRFFVIRSPSKDPEDSADEYFSCDDREELDSNNETDEGSRDHETTSYPVKIRNEKAQGGWTLARINLFPIKSCAAQEIDGPWRLTEAGLEYDRQFCIIDLANGKIMSQKKVKALARIRPAIDLTSQTMSVKFLGVDGAEVSHTSISISLEKEEWQVTVRDIDFCEGDSVIRPALLKNPEVQRRFSEFLGQRCTLARSNKSPMNTSRLPLSLSNESPFLVISKQSVEKVCDWIEEDEGIRIDSERVALCFRSNFIIDSERGQAFDEDSARRLIVGNTPFAVMGPCRRCEMIALDQITGRPVNPVLKAVASHRRCARGHLRGRILFGAHLSWLHDLCSQSEWIQVGTPVILQKE